MGDMYDKTLLLKEKTYIQKIILWEIMLSIIQTLYASSEYTHKIGIFYVNSLYI